MSENEGKDRAARRARQKQRRVAQEQPATAAAVVENVPPRPPRRTATSDREAVLAVNAMFYRAFETRDIEAMAELWAKVPHVRCIHPGWEPLAGWDEVVGSWEQIFGGREALRFELVDVTVRVGGSLAWVELCEKLQAAHQGGVARSQVLATNIFERQPDGRWQMVHHHASPVMVRQAVPRRDGENLH